jgi:hypothetical protein
MKAAVANSDRKNTAALLKIATFKDVTARTSNRLIRDILIHSIVTRPSPLPQFK